MLLKNKIQLSFKDLIGFIQQFMNQTASNLADRKGLQRVLQGKRFCKQKGDEQGSCTEAVKEGARNARPQNVPLWHADCF